MVGPEELGTKDTKNVERRKYYVEISYTKDHYYNTMNRSRTLLKYL